MTRIPPSTAKSEHWEGDALVVNTIAIDESSGSATWKYPSDQEHVSERYTLPRKNYMIHEVTIEDPKMLTKPWHSAPHRFTLSITDEPWASGTAELSRMKRSSASRNSGSSWESEGEDEGRGAVSKAPYL